MFNLLRLDFYCDRNILSIIGLERKTENKRERERERKLIRRSRERERERGKEREMEWGQKRSKVEEH